MKLVSVVVEENVGRFTPRTRTFETVERDVLDDTGVIIICHTNRHAQRAADLCVELWERGAPTLLLRGPHVGAWPHAHPVSCVVDIEDLELWPTVVGMFTDSVGKSESLLVSDLLTDRSGVDARLVVGDDRPGVFLREARDLRRHEPGPMLITPADAEFSNFTDQCDLEDGLDEFFVVLESSPRTLGLHFLLVGELPNPTQRHTLSTEWLPPDPRDFDGSLVPPEGTREIAVAIATSHLAHGRYDLTTEAVRTAGGSDARQLAASVLALLGEPVEPECEGRFGLSLVAEGGLDI